MQHDPPGCFKLVGLATLSANKKNIFTGRKTVNDKISQYNHYKTVNIDVNSIHITMDVYETTPSEINQIIRNLKKSLMNGDTPLQLQNNVVPIFKKGIQDLCENYRLMSIYVH